MRLTTLAAPPRLELLGEGEWHRLAFAFGRRSMFFQLEFVHGRQQLVAADGRSPTADPF